MQPVDFPEKNMELQPPAGSGPGECATLPIFFGGTYSVSCWRLTDEDIDLLKNNRNVWLVVMGTNHPPVALTVDEAHMVRMMEGGYGDLEKTDFDEI